MSLVDFKKPTSFLGLGKRTAPVLTTMRGIRFGVGDVPTLLQQVGRRVRRVELLLDFARFQLVVVGTVIQLMVVMVMVVVMVVDVHFVLDGRRTGAAVGGARPLRRAASGLVVHLQG